MIKHSVLIALLLMLLPLPVSAINISGNCTAGTLLKCFGYDPVVPDHPGTVSDTPQYSSTFKCGKDQVIDFGSRRLSTNLWGTPSEEDISLNDNCVFKYPGYFGWSWSRKNPIAFQGENNTAPIYPSVGTGTDPWGGYSTSKYLPVRIMNISLFTLDVSYYYAALPSPSDSVNLAYDIWITDTDKPNPETPRNEVMIWLNRLNVPMPEDKRLEDVSDGYNTYRQYAWENYTSFILNAAPSSGTKYHKANPKRLIDYLVAKGNLNKALWISKIDLGNEVWDSSGKIEIINYNIKINNILI